MKGKGIFLLSLLCVFVAAACNQKAEAPQPASTQTTGTVAPSAQAGTIKVAEVGAPMPAYSAEMLDGTTFDIAKERGNVVFLNLWATWCGPCRYEIPELEKLHKEHSGQRFKVVGVSVDEGGDQIVRDFVAEQKVSYPIVLDPQNKLSYILDTVILPTSILVDRSGKVVWKKVGVVTSTDEDMVKALDAALKT